MNRPARLVLAVAAASLLFTGAAAAQDAGTVAKPTCKRPEFPGKLASEAKRKDFNKDVEAYADCIKKYVAERQRLADENIKAANQAATDYNTTVKQIQAEIDAAK